MSKVREVWRPKQMSASGTLVDRAGQISGFMCTTAGTVSITDGTTSGGATIVAPITTVAGTWYPLPFQFDNGAYANITGVVTFGVG
jgi:hypothetical protein